MKKYTIFNLYSGGTLSVLTASIVGFSSPEPRLCWTNVILESGCEIALNGTPMDEAKKAYSEALIDGLEKKGSCL